MQILILWVWMCHFCGLMFFFSCSTYLFFLSLLSLHARGCRVAGATATTHATNAAIFIFRTSSMRSPNDWGNFIKRTFCSATCYVHIRSRSYVVCKQLEQTSGWQDIQVTALDSEIGQFFLAVIFCCEGLVRGFLSMKFSGNHVHTFHTIWPSCLLAYTCNLTHYKKICIIIFQKWGGGQRPFGIFPKNHPIW